ncbi:hypothetical protein [Lactovum odontotermitis]
MRLKHKIVQGSALSVLLLASASTAVFTAPAQADTSQGVKMYRLYNPNTGEHFYTQYPLEMETTVAAGWNFEGIGWVAPSSGDPIYRVYNPNAKGGDHYYTKNKSEANWLVGLGWKWDNNSNPVFYSGGSTPIYVAYNPNADSGAHNYTANSGEQNTLLSVGWTYGEVAWNALAMPTQTSAATNIYPGNFADPKISKNGSTYTLFGGGTNALSSSSLTGGYSNHHFLLTSKVPYADSDTLEPQHPSVWFNGSQYVLYFGTRVNGIVVIATATSNTFDGPYTPSGSPLLSQGRAYYSNFLDPYVSVTNGRPYLFFGTDQVLGNNVNSIELLSNGLSTVGSMSMALKADTVTDAYNRSTKVSRVESSAVTQAPDGTYIMFFSANDVDQDNSFVGWASSPTINGTYTYGGAILTNTSILVTSPQEPSLYSENGTNYLVFNGWVGPHDGWKILSGGSGRNVFIAPYIWMNGHVPVVNYAQ